MQPGGDARLQRERVPGGEQTDACDRRPERERLVLEDEPAGCGPDEPADLPRRAGERHVTAEQPRLGQVDDERRIDRAMQALAEREHADCDPEHDRSLRPGQPGSAGHHRQKRPGPHDSHQREAA